jgi:hypothetical protein
MKLGGTRRTEELIPGIRPESGDAREAGLYVTKLDCANQSGEIRTKGAQIRASVLVLPDAHHEENRRPRKRTNHSLRENDLVELAGCVHIYNFDLRWLSPEYRIFT